MKANLFFVNIALLCFIGFVAFAIVCVLFVGTLPPKPPEYSFGIYLDPNDIWRFCVPADEPNISFRCCKSNTHLQ